MKKQAEKEKATGAETATTRDQSALSLEISKLSVFLLKDVVFLVHS